MLNTISCLHISSYIRRGVEKVWRGSKPFISNHLGEGLRQGSLAKKKRCENARWQVLDRGEGECKSNFFSHESIYYPKVPLTSKTAHRYGNAQKIPKKIFNLLWGNKYFPNFCQFWYFSMEVWERRSRAVRRYGYTPFPRVPVGNDPCPSPLANVDCAFSPTCGLLACFSI